MNIEILTQNDGHLVADRCVPPQDAADVRTIKSTDVAHKHICTLDVDMVSTRQSIAGAWRETAASVDRGLASPITAEYRFIGFYPALRDQLDGKIRDRAVQCPDHPTS